MKLTNNQMLQEGILAHKEGNLQDAERLYRAILKEQPFHPDANHNLGVLVASVNKTEEALSLFKIALEVNSKIEQYWLSYIDALIKEKQFNLAKLAISNAKDAGVIVEKLNAFEALAIASSGRKEPSKEQLNTVLKYYQASRLNDTEKTAEFLTKEFPEHPFGWKVLGAVLKQTNRDSEALIANQKSVQLAPKDADVHCNLGVTLKALGRLQEAEKSFRQAIMLKSEYAVVHYNLANTLNALGRLDKAEVSYRKAIILEPDYAEAYGNLGNLLKELDRLEEAEVSYRKAIKLKSDYVEAHNNLGTLLQSLSRFNEAELSYRRAITLEPNYAEAHCNLGTLLQELDRLEEAEASYSNAIKSRSNFAKAHSNLGTLLQALGKLEESEVSLKQAITLDPDHAEAYYNYGITLVELGRLEEAKTSYRRATSLKFEFAEAHNNLGTLFHVQGKYEYAEESFKKAITLKPDYAEAHSNFGALLKELGKIKKAEASFKKAIDLQPHYAKAHSNLGILLQEVAEFEKAEASFRKATDLKSDYAEAHRHLSSIKKFVSQDSQFLKMVEIYQRKRISEKEFCHINFALAKAYEDLDDCEQAFKHYKEGNSLRKKLLNYDINQDLELFSQLKTNYFKIKKEALELISSTKKPIPIFIIGIPRSGTTLVEQIISSHPQVTGAGELTFVAEFGEELARGLSRTTRDELMKFRKKYLMKLRNLSNGKAFVTDKMPQNFYYLGLITAAIPEAKIVHVQRNPAAVCWANYKQYFNSEKLGYCYDLNDILSYYDNYKKLMHQWGKLFYDRIYNLDYEVLTVNLESETRKLISYLNLAWDEKCMSPQDNTRRVTTASNLQIREVVYQGSSKQWKKFQPYLNGMLDNINT